MITEESIKKVERLKEIEKKLIKYYDEPFLKTVSSNIKWMFLDVIIALTISVIVLRLLSIAPYPELIKQIMGVIAFFAYMDNGKIGFYGKYSGQFEAKRLMKERKWILKELEDGTQC